MFNTPCFTLKVKGWSLHIYLPLFESNKGETWLLLFWLKRLNEGNSLPKGILEPKAVAPPHHRSPGKGVMLVTFCACEASAKKRETKSVRVRLYIFLFVVKMFKSYLKNTK